MAAKSFYALEFILKLNIIIDGNYDPLPPISAELQLLKGNLERSLDLYSDSNFSRYMERDGFQREKMHIKTEGFKSLVHTAEFIHSAPVISKASGNDKDVNRIIGSLYSDMWPLRSDEEFLDWGTPFLKERLILNGIDLDWFNGKICLDAGCGGGRTTVALLNLGVKKAFGLDIGEGNIRDATERAEKAGLKNITFNHGSVFEMPFENDTFDFVMCQGVLHHTPDIAAGLREIQRVLKPGGHLWVYLYGKSLFYDLIEMTRDIVADVPYALLANYMLIMGWALETYLYYQTMLFTPFRTQLSATELKILLKETGFSSWERHYRDIERENWITYQEAVYRKLPYADVKHGEGELRYWATK